MLIQIIEGVYRLLWGDLLTLHLGNVTLSLSFMVILLLTAGVFFTLRHEASAGAAVPGYAGGGLREERQGQRPLVLPDAGGVHGHRVGMGQSGGRRWRRCLWAVQARCSGCG